MHTQTCICTHLHTGVTIHHYLHNTYWTYPYVITLHRGAVSPCPRSEPQPSHFTSHLRTRLKRSTAVQTLPPPLQVICFLKMMAPPHTPILTVNIKRSSRYITHAITSASPAEYSTSSPETRHGKERSISSYEERKSQTWQTLVEKTHHKGHSGIAKCCKQAATERNGWYATKKSMTSIEQKCRVREKGTKIVTEELQQRIVAKSAKCERYEARCGKIRQDMLKNMN